MVSGMPTSGAASITRPAALDEPTLCAAFARTAAERGDAVALRTPGDGVRVTWREYAERMADDAAGLAALGVGPGDTVAIMLTNRPEFHVLDCAAMHLRAVPFSVYNTSSPEQLEYLLGDVTASGQGVSTDIIEAAGRAYVRALSNAERRRAQAERDAEAEVAAAATP